MNEASLVVTDGLGREEKRLDTSPPFADLHHLSAWEILVAHAHAHLQAESDRRWSEERERTENLAYERESAETLTDLRDAAKKRYNLTISEHATVVATLKLLAFHAHTSPSIAEWHAKLKTQWETYCTTLLRYLDVPFRIRMEELYGADAMNIIFSRITFIDSANMLWPGGDTPPSLMRATAQFTQYDRSQFPLIVNPYTRGVKRSAARARVAERVVIPSFEANVRAEWARGVELFSDAWHNEFVRPRVNEVASAIDRLSTDVSAVPRQPSNTPIGTFTQADGHMDQLRKLGERFRDFVGEIFPRHRTWDTLAAELQTNLDAARAEQDTDSRLFLAIAEAEPQVELVQASAYVAQVSTTCVRALETTLEQLDRPPLRGIVSSACLRCVNEVCTAFRDERDIPSNARVPEPALHESINHIVGALVNLPADAHPAVVAVRTWRARLYVTAVQLDYTRLRMDRLLRFMRAAAAMPPSRWAETWLVLCNTDTVEAPSLSRARRLDAHLVSAPSVDAFHAMAVGALQRVRAAIGRSVSEPLSSLAPPPAKLPDVDENDMITAFTPFRDAVATVHRACVPTASRSPSLQTWLREMRKCQNTTHATLTLYFTTLRYVTATLRLAEAFPARDGDSAPAQRPASPPEPLADLFVRQ